ncbi:MAG: dTDP-4-dehydrorhamnose reductase [Chlamydiales bacterium]
MERDSFQGNIIVTGASGLVGAHLVHALENQGRTGLYGLYNSHPCRFQNCIVKQVDITDREAILSLSTLEPKLIIHCAAIANIAFCESKPELSYKVNVQGTRNLVDLAKECQAKMVYLSTDAVFDGKRGDYLEKEEPFPLNQYGRTKLKGEQCCSGMLPDALIVRFNTFGKYLFSQKKSFAENIAESLQQGREYSAFADVVFAPLYVKELVRIVLALIEKNAGGIYHVVGSEILTKYQFALKVAEIFGYDSSLVKKGSIDSQPIPREKKLNLCNIKMLGALGEKSTPGIERMLIEFCSSLLDKKVY